MSDWINLGAGREAAINFGKMANMSESEMIAFDGYVDSSSGYTLSTDGTKFRLPLNSLETVCSVSETGLNKRIVLPYHMPWDSDILYDFNYRSTFKNCTIERCGDWDGLWFTLRVTTNVTSMFESATFMTGARNLAIDDSALKVNSMFYNSKGLSNLTFDGCSLTDLRKLTLGSDIRELEFKKCKFILDNDYLVTYDDISALTVFGSKIEKLILRNCSRDFVELVMNLFEDEWDLYPRLEIEILD
jgi:hypothetical protein